MWIISKLSGAINANQVTRFTETPAGTHAHFRSYAFLITEKHILSTIVETLKNGENFLEVE